MSNSTHELLEMITALRQRLEQAQNRELDDDTAASLLETLQGPHRLQAVRQRLAEGTREQDALQRIVRQAAPELPDKKDEAARPAHLTARAARLLQQTRDQVQRLRCLADDSTLEDEENHPAAMLYQDSVLLADLALRTIQTLPSSPNLQMRLAAGIDVLLAWIDQRCETVEAILQQERTDREQLAELTRLLVHLRQGTLRDWNSFFTLAEAIAEETTTGRLLRFCAADVSDPPRYVAAHCLNVARVIARVARKDLRWRSRLLQPVVAALVHDAGMLAVPRGVLGQAQSLNEEQLAVVEKHCRLGARWAERVGSPEAWLIEAIRSHHERLDGLGYPAGLTEMEIDPLVRLLAVCDVYAALCCRRPHRQALEPASALAEVLQMVRRDELDSESAQLLQQLSPYPPGLAVEMTDGSCGVVAALSTAALGSHQPVVLLLTDSAGKPLPFPQVIELVEGEGAIARCLQAAERRKLFGNSYPQWA